MPKAKKETKEKANPRVRCKGKAAPKPAAKGAACPPGAGAACPPEDNAACPPATGAEASSSSNLTTFDAPRLLTALKYQVVSKKTSPTHKEAAQKLLEDYKNGDRKRKWEILESLTKKGYADLSWTHARSEATSRKESERSEVLSGMMTRAQILKLNGFDEQQCEDDMAKTLLEDLLQESESLYGHDRNEVLHRNPMLNRYYYKHSNGTREAEEITKEDRVEAWAEQQSQKLNKSLGLEDCREGGDGSSDTFKAWSSMTANLKKLKTAMQTVEDQVLVAEKRMETSQHEDASMRKKELQDAKVKLQDGLQELRLHLMDSSTKHKRTDDCTESIQERTDMKQKMEDITAECAAQIELSRKCWVTA